MAKAKRRAIFLAWAVAASLIAIVALKHFVADVFPVRSSSMVPTIYGGDATHSGKPFEEWVLVAWDTAPRLARHDLVVWQPPTGDPIVKRVEGLPGERLRIADGDVLIEGQRVGSFAASPQPVVVFDGSALDVGEYFEFKPESWTRDEDGTWNVDGSKVQRGSNAGMMLFRRRLRDDHIDPYGQRVAGITDVNDAVLECEVRLNEPFDPKTRLRLQLVEDGDTFQVFIESDGKGGFNARLLRNNPQESLVELFHGAVAFTDSVWQRLVFANVDNVLTLHIDGQEALNVRYERNVPLGTHARRQTIGPRVGYGIEAGHASFRSIVVLRDLYYTESGDYAATSLLSLGLDEYFLLGDNSNRSKDSRHFGPVPASQLVGRPVAVVWPLSRARWLR